MTSNRNHRRSHRRRKERDPAMTNNTAKRHLASLAFLVFSAILLVAVLRTPPARRVAAVDLTRPAAGQAGWYEESPAGSGTWVYRTA